MKDTIYSFKRTEMKFLLTPYQYAALMREIENNIKPDDYPESHIENIYYDTPTDYLIRTSLEKPIYKEKLRLRTYGVPNSASPAFLEIKKKYDGIVYKRRIEVPYEAALEYMCTPSAAGADGRASISPDSKGTADRYCAAGSKSLLKDSQIKREIDAFKARYEGLAPRMVISYDRKSYLARNDEDLRITFDSHIRYRSTDLDLADGPWGKELLDEGFCLMEVKAAGAIPLALARTFSRLNIRQTSFSKYGSAYIDELKGKQEASDFAVDKSKMPLYNLA